MVRAIAECTSLCGPDDIPVAALVVSAEGALLAVAGNRREADTDPTAHAEVLALRAAAAHAGSWRLLGATLYVTLEPCPMCAGAAVNARVSRIVFGAWNPDYGACGSMWDLPRDRRLSHRCEVLGGIRESECSELVRQFFTPRRAGT
ncbi:MAG: nucleoside deaminase [Candidatus Nanopelagicales bacterium]|nr:nucleoside deaminase [Candidatus Nanopelagicales bacterium]MDZ4250190.1 nucleoside deaminase [Candidatus Nanopelagicales bacterium]